MRRLARWLEAHLPSDPDSVQRVSRAARGRRQVELSFAAAVRGLRAALRPARSSPRPCRPDATRAALRARDHRQNFGQHRDDPLRGVGYAERARVLAHLLEPRRIGRRARGCSRSSRSAVRHRLREHDGAAGTLHESRVLRFARRRWCRERHVERGHAELAALVHRAGARARAIGQRGRRVDLGELGADVGHDRVAAAPGSAGSAARRSSSHRRSPVAGFSPHWWMICACARSRGSASPTIRLMRCAPEGAAGDVHERDGRIELEAARWRSTASPPKLGPQRIARHDHAGRPGSLPVLVGKGDRDAPREPGADPVREPGHRRLLVQDDRHARDRGREHHRQRDEAAGAEDDLGRSARRARTAPSMPIGTFTARSADVLPRPVAPELSGGDRDVGDAGRGNALGFDTGARADPRAR